MTYIVFCIVKHLYIVQPIIIYKVNRFVKWDVIMREDRELFHKPTREMVLTSNQDARVVSRVKIKPAPLDRMLQRVKTARRIRDLPEAEQPQPANKTDPYPRRSTDPEHPGIAATR